MITAAAILSTLASVAGSHVASLFVTRLAKLGWHGYQQQREQRIQSAALKWLQQNSPQPTAPSEIKQELPSAPVATQPVKAKTWTPRK